MRGGNLYAPEPMSADEEPPWMRHIHGATQRLAAKDLATDVNGDRRLNAAGFQTLADLAVVMMKAASTGTRAERALSLTCRALLSLQAAVAAELAGEPSDPQALSTAKQALSGALREAGEVEGDG